MNYTKDQRSNLVTRYGSRPTSDDDAPVVIKLAHDCNELEEQLNQTQAVIETLERIIAKQRPAKDYRNIGPG